MNQRPPEEQLAEQIRDGIQSLPLRQKILLLRLVLRLQEDDGDETWAWALGIDDTKGGNGNVTGSGY